MPSDRRNDRRQSDRLLVDGLDEALDARAAETLAALLISYVERRNAPALVTSRPQGLHTISRFGGTWKHFELAPLSDKQQYALCKIWFRVLAEREATNTPDASRVESRAERSAKQFGEALQKIPDISRLSQVPLFLLALMDLARHGYVLPSSRFAASREIIAQLIEHQPHKRDTGALVVVNPSSNTKLRDRLLAHGKYPPAKPGALELEPLEAAIGALRGPNI